MSHYKRGCDGAVMGREFMEYFTPSTVRTMMRQVDDNVEVLSRDMQTAPVSASLKYSFELFKRTWKDFYASHQGWFSRSLNTTYDQVESFGRQVDAYRDKLARSGVETAVPTLKPRRGVIEMSPLKIVALSLAGALGILFLGRRL